MLLEVLRRCPIATSQTTTNEVKLKGIQFPKSTITQQPQTTRIIIEDLLRQEERAQALSVKWQTINLVLHGTFTLS
jgi:hypothetical protein